MKKHYLFLMKTNQLYGAERRLVDIFSYVDHDVYLITWAVNDKNAFLPYLKSKNLPVRLIQLPVVRGWGIIKKFFNMYNFFKTIKPDCIVFSQFYLNSFSLFDLISGFLVSKGNTYMVVHDEAYAYTKYTSKLHFGIIPRIGIKWHRERIFQKLMVYFTKYTLAVSKEVKEILINFHTYPAYKIKLFYHGKDLKKFCPDILTRYIMRKKFNIPENDSIIISTSRLAETKCVDRLINVFDFVFQENKDIWLFILGNGKLRDKLEKLAMEKNAKHRIKFLGFQEDIPSYLKMSDVFVLSSDIEGFGNVVFEAMATGLITVSTKVAGPDEVIKDGINGFLVERSEEGILNGLLRAFSLSENERIQITSNARRHIEVNFDIDKRVEEELAILELKSNRHFKNRQ